MTQLTVCQQDADSAFYNFLSSSDRTFVLSGNAGVGKTFLMGHFYRVTLKNYIDTCALLGVPAQYETVEFTATTNKAAEVLEKSLGIPVSTIHSLLALKVKEDHRTGKTVLEKTDRWKRRRNILLFVDESSMIDTVLYDIILDSFPDCKIVFVGDHAQMAPVNEETSPVYQNVDPKNFAFLKTPVRNAGSNALVKFCAQLRQTVETGVFQPIEAVPGVIEYLDPNQMQQKLYDHFLTEEPSARILAYTNSRVVDYNHYIREIRGKPRDIQAGDVLVVAQAFARGKMVLNVEREVHVIDVDPTIHEGGYAMAFSDGLPVTYRNVRIRLRHLDGAEFVVPVALDQERLNRGIKALAQRKDWPSYFGLKNLCADLRDRDACTVYKSQGSTYETVFIDLGNIGTSRDAKQVARMLFVAASRATTRVYLFGELPEWYQGRKAA